jgi:hypothetical protein
MAACGPEYLESIQSFNLNRPSFSGSKKQRYRSFLRKRPKRKVLPVRNIACTKTGSTDTADGLEEGPFSTLRGAWIILLAFIDGSLIVELGMLRLKGYYSQSGTVW